MRKIVIAVVVVGIMLVCATAEAKSSKHSGGYSMQGSPVSQGQKSQHIVNPRPTTQVRSPRNYTPPRGMAGPKSSNGGWDGRRAF